MSEQDDRDRYRYLQLKAKMGGQQQEPQTDYKQVIGQSIKNLVQKPAAFAKDLGTNPESMSRAMPTVMGLGGMMMMPWGGATVGTGAGQGLRDLGLKALGKPIPGMMQHGIELGSAVLGDVAAIPSLKAAHYGGLIGKAEKAKGVIAQGAEKAITPGSVGQTLRDLEAQINAGTINTAQGAKDAKEIIDQVYKNPRIYEKSPGIEVQSARVSEKVQKLMNRLIPGREAPAKAMGQALTPQRFIGKGYKALPSSVKRGIGIGAGTVAGGVPVYELLKHLLGIGGP